MNFEFENRWYSKHEILKKFNIAEKTWKNWLYDSKTGKKKKQWKAEDQMKLLTRLRS